MRILIACEYSGIVRDAFIKKGHDVVSCDFLPTEVPGPHYMGDVRDILNEFWDMMIAHPDCTYLTNSAAWAFKDGPYHQKVKPGTLVGAKRRRAREKALEFYRTLYEAPIDKICIENPPGAASTAIAKPTQYIHPHQFGHDASKITGLLLKGLPPLEPTHHIAPRLVCCGETVTDKYGCPNCNGDNIAKPRWGNQTNSGQNKLTPSEKRWMDRARTYQGWADAMADQWG